MICQRVNRFVIEKSIEGPFITAVVGQRRVGKTFLLTDYAKQHPRRTWVFLNMDSLVERQRVEKAQLSSLISEHIKRPLGTGEKTWVVIDEVQKCPEAFNQIKMLYDQYKDQQKIKFILTGSAVLDLHKLTAESLAGRIEIYALQEFNLREATSLYEPHLPTDSVFDLLGPQVAPDTLENLVNQLAPFRPRLTLELEQQFIWGGFPELFNLPTTEEKIIYLRNYFQTYLEKDIRSIGTITDLNLYRNMMDILAEQTGSVRDDQRIVSALACTRETLKKYRGYLAATLLFMDIYPYIGSSLKRLVKSPKGYLLSNGIISILTGLTDLSILVKTGMIGHRMENWFLNELLVWTARMPLRQAICYWRAASGVEVDFVVVKKPTVLPFEVTYQDQVDRKKVRSLTQFLREEPKASWGYYIYRGEFEVDEKNKIIFLPAWIIG